MPHFSSHGRGRSLGPEPSPVLSDFYACSACLAVTKLCFIAREELCDPTPSATPQHKHRNTELQPLNSGRPFGKPALSYSAFMLSLLHWLVWIWKRAFLGC